MELQTKRPKRLCVSAYLLVCWSGSLCLSLGQSVNDTSSPTDVAGARNASADAYLMFHLALAQEDDNEVQEAHNALAEVVLKDGKVQDNWLPPSEGETFKAQSLDSMFHHDQFTDRISFEFSFGSFLSYDIRTPTVSSSNESVAKPKVIDFQTDDDEHSGSYSIVYDCHRHPANDQLQNATVSVVFPVVSGLSLFYSFRKTCGGGEHKFMEFGYFEESENAASEVSRVPFTSYPSAISFGPHVMSTKIYLHLRHPATSQEFFHVNATSSSASLMLHTRGPTFGGVVKASESAVVHVLYDCRGSGEIDVYFTVPIYPYQQLSASWKKDCGGGLARGLNVGTSLSNKSDVVSMAGTHESWKLALQTTSTSISDKAPVVNSSVRFIDFWLSNDGIPIHAAPVVITVENPAVLVAFSSDLGGKRPPHNHEDSGLMPSGSNLRLRVRMICKKKGKSLVIVTFPVKSFSNVEFGFVKQCKAPRRYVHSGFLRTANSAMFTSTILLAGAFAYWWFLQLRSVSKPIPSYHRLQTLL